MTIPAPYTALLLGATGNVGGALAQLLIDSPLCGRLVLVIAGAKMVIEVLK